jgi:hypothetical protein
MANDPDTRPDIGVVPQVSDTAHAHSFFMKLLPHLDSQTESSILRCPLTAPGLRTELP